MILEALCGLCFGKYSFIMPIVPWLEISPLTWNTKTTMVSHNLLNNLEFEHETTDRAVQILHSIFDRDLVQFDVYIRDEENNLLADSAKKTFKLRRHDIDEGNIFRHFYTQHLQKIEEPHNIDTSTSLKPKAERPSMTIYPTITTILYSHSQVYTYQLALIYIGHPRRHYTL